MTLSYETGWYEPYYSSGSGAEAAAGLAYPVSLGAIPYLFDTSERYRADFQHSSVPLLRVASDERENASLGSLNPEAFWRRSFESWHVGAGQTHFDRRDESNPWRFRRSKNVDVWTRNQVGLLNATDAKALFDDTNVFLAVAGDFLYVSDGNELKRTADVAPDTATLTTITGVPANDISAIASDGFNVLTAHGSNGIYKTTRGAATTASQITGTVNQVFYGKGRWLASQDNILYDITTLVAGGVVALPTPHFTHHNTDFDWTAFAEGPTAVYAAGTSGDKSQIFRLTMKEDGTGLNQPVAATPGLPDGETVHSMHGYLGFVLIGTSKGVRIGVVGGNGDLTVGAFIPTDDPVRCFEGQEKFVWFGWSNFEGTDAGLGRIDLETFSDPEALAPAYASDLMTGSAGGIVTSVVTFQDRRVFGISSGGAAGLIYAEEPGVLALVGEIDSGLFDYGLTDEKLSLYVDMAHVHHGGSHEVWMSLDRGSFAELAEMETEHHPIATGEARANEFEIRIVFNRDGSDTSMGPVIRSWALRVQPASPITEQITVPLVIGPAPRRVDAFVESVDPSAQLDNIVDLCRSKEVTLYTEGDRAWSVIVADYQMDIRDVYVASDSALGFTGTCLVRMKSVV